MQDPVTGDVIADQRKISLRYLKGWFAIDLLATFPVDYIVRMAEGTWICSLRGNCLWSAAAASSGGVDAIRMLRVLRVFRSARSSHDVNKAGIILNGCACDEAAGGNCHRWTSSLIKQELFSPTNPLDIPDRILWILKHFKFMRFSTMLGGLTVSATSHPHRCARWRTAPRPSPPSNYSALTLTPRSRRMSCTLSGRCSASWSCWSCCSTWATFLGASSTCCPPRLTRLRWRSA